MYTNGSHSLSLPALYIVLKVHHSPKQCFHWLHTVQPSQAAKKLQVAIKLSFLFPDRQLDLHMLSVSPDN